MRLVAFDLDDTLVREMDFVRSAWLEIAATLSAATGESAEQLLGVMENNGNPYDNLYAYLTVKGYQDVPADREMVDMYRRHRPAALPLIKGAAETLGTLIDGGCTLALVTDGRVGTQSAKIAAASLDKFFQSDLILISEATGHDKSSSFNFSRLMEITGVRADECWYVGDNPAKDFYMPRRLGWRTVCLRMRNENIHPQDFDNTPPERMPEFIIDNLRELINLVAPAQGDDSDT